MHSKARFQSSVFGMSFSPKSGRLATVLTLLFPIFLFSLLAFTPQPAQGRTYRIIYNFIGGQDGGQPYAGLTMDTAGNLYGTTWIGGYTGGACANSGGCGTVFKLSNRSSGWALRPLYAFQGSNDGAQPEARVVFGPGGSLYGTTADNYSNNGTGTVFNLRPPATACKTALCPWTETVLYGFSGGSDGASPGQGDVVFDRAGNLYGTTSAWFTNDGGTVFQLTYSNGYWTFSTLHSFTGSIGPETSLSMDVAGALYGTTYTDGTYGYGNVFKLTHSGEGWIYTSLYDFRGAVTGDYQSATSKTNSRPKPAEQPKSERKSRIKQYGFSRAWDPPSSWGWRTFNPNGSRKSMELCFGSLCFLSEGVMLSDRKKNCGFTNAWYIAAMATPSPELLRQFVISLGDKPRSNPTWNIYGNLITPIITGRETAGGLVVFESVTPPKGGPSTR